MKHHRCPPKTRPTSWARSKSSPRWVCGLCALRSSVPAGTSYRTDLDAPSHRLPPPLLQQAELLEKRKEVLEKKIENELAKAKASLKQGNKAGE